jgi:hypothetical protein
MDRHIARCDIPTSNKRFSLAIENGFQSFPQIRLVLFEALYLLLTAILTRHQRHEGIFCVVADTNFNRRPRLPQRTACCRRTWVTEYRSFICFCTPIVDMCDHAMKDRAPLEQIGRRRSRIYKPAWRIDQPAQQTVAVVTLLNHFGSRRREWFVLRLAIPTDQGVSKCSAFGNFSFAVWLAKILERVVPGENITVLGNERGERW